MTCCCAASRNAASAQRLDLRHEPAPGQKHWHVYKEVDIAVDPFPWSGHHSNCEALWMGVPVVTLRGNRHAGRMVASVLTTLGMTDWIAETPEQYVALAVEKTASWIACATSAPACGSRCKPARFATASTLPADWKTPTGKCRAPGATNHKRPDPSLRRKSHLHDR